MTTEFDDIEPVGRPRRHLSGCVLEPDHGAGCVRQQWAADDPAAPWNVVKPTANESGDR